MLHITTDPSIIVHPDNLNKNIDIKPLFKKHNNQYILSPPQLQGPAPGPAFFDGHYYLEKYPDLRQNGVQTEQQALAHWLTCGEKEGRAAIRPPAFFDWQYYLEKYPDLRKNGVQTEQQALTHWLTCGEKEGRVAIKTPALFDWRYYLQTYPDLRKNGVQTEQQALTHWHTFGTKEKRVAIKTFYVCSYGGSGSKMLCTALEKYGNVKHIHSRNPPDKLEYIGEDNGGSAYCEWFNGIPIPENDLKTYYVIYIYRNPCRAINSRFIIPAHLDHIQADKNINLQDVLNTGTDLYKIREFYDNYTTPNIKRNYKIYCVKYEDIFEQQDELSKLLGVGKLNIVNKSKNKPSNTELDNIYADLITIMNKNKFISIN